MTNKVKVVTHFDGMVCGDPKLVNDMTKSAQNLYRELVTFSTLGRPLSLEITVADGINYSLIVILKYANSVEIVCKVHDAHRRKIWIHTVKELQTKTINFDSLQPNLDT